MNSLCGFKRNSFFFLFAKKCQIRWLMKHVYCDFLNPSVCINNLMLKSFELFFLHYFIISYWFHYNFIQMAFHELNFQWISFEWNHQSGKIPSTEHIISKMEKKKIKCQENYKMRIVYWQRLLNFFFLLLLLFTFYFISLSISYCCCLAMVSTFKAETTDVNVSVFKIMDNFTSGK